MCLCRHASFRLNAATLPDVGMLYPVTTVQGSHGCFKAIFEHTSEIVHPDAGVVLPASNNEQCCDALKLTLMS